jgi:hypothetical protein
MVRRKPPTSRPEPRQLTVEEMKKAVSRIQRRIEELNALDPATASDDQVRAVERSIEETLCQVFGKGTDDYYLFASATNLDKGPLTIGMRRTERETRGYWAQGKTSALSTLGGAVRTLEERIEYADPEDAAAPPPEPPRERPGPGRSVVNVYGSGNFVGNASHSNVTFNVVKGDFGSLKQALAGKGVSQTDIEELRSALEAEPTPPPNGKHGPRVAKWIGSMVAKAAEGTWGVAVGAAGTLLAQLIGGYYGLE